MRALYALLQDHTYVQLPKKAATATTASAPNAAAVAANSVAEPSLTGDHAATDWQSHGQSMVKTWAKHGQGQVNAGGKSAIATTQNVQGKTVNAAATYVRQQHQLQQLQNQQENLDATSPRKLASAGGGASISIQQQQPTAAASREATGRKKVPILWLPIDPATARDPSAKPSSASTVSSATSVTATVAASPLIPGFPFGYNGKHSPSPQWKYLQI